MSDGALCVFLDGYTGREGKPVPLIIRKSDGGYGYATTDLATVRYRVATLHADRILYVVGAPQSLHFQMVWAAARLAGWLPDSVTTTHVQIGNVLGPDKKIRLSMTYPMSIGRNFAEILRALDAVQATDGVPFATPANWVPGQDVIVALSVSTEDATATPTVAPSAAQASEEESAEASTATGTPP